MTTLKRQNISLNKFKEVIEDSEIIVKSRRWPKVIKKGDDYTKFFNYAGKNIRRRTLNPVATQFVRNAEHINALGIKTIAPNYWARCREAQCDLVCYPSIPGQTVYHSYESKNDASLLTNLAGYVAELHNKNFYFRHGHSDNYLIQDDGSFAIIDMDNVRYSMNRRRKAKNLFYLLDHAERNNQDLYANYGISRFLETYFASSGASPAEQEYITTSLHELGLKIT